MNIRGMLFDNWGIKLVSLALALSLWFYVTAKGKTEVTLNVPLELRNIPSGMTVVGDVTGYVDVRVQGQERAIRDSVQGKKVSGIIDLSAAREGENRVPVSPDDIRRPAGLTVMHLSPSEVKVRLDRLVRKSFRLRPVLRGAPAPGYRVTGITVIPPRLTGEGPSAALASADRLQTLPIDIQGATEGLSVEPRIDYQGLPVKLLDSEIMVKITVERTNR